MRSPSRKRCVHFSAMQLICRKDPLLTDSHQYGSSPSFNSKAAKRIWIRSIRRYEERHGAWRPKMHVRESLASLLHALFRWASLFGSAEVRLCIRQVKPVFSRSDLQLSSIDFGKRLIMLAKWSKNRKNKSKRICILIQIGFKLYPKALHCFHVWLDLRLILSLPAAVVFTTITVSLLTLPFSLHNGYMNHG